MTKNEKLAFKAGMKTAAVQLLEQRIKTVELAMLNAQEAANNEDKSSAGDKYETSRAMGQIDRDMNARQLEKGNAELRMIQAIDVSAIHDEIRSGSAVVAAEKIFFVGIGLGQLIIHNQAVIFLSPLAPLANKLLGKKCRDSFQFQGKPMKIEDVF